jgi:osmotically-inducible protein OsmY
MYEVVFGAVPFGNSVMGQQQQKTKPAEKQQSEQQQSEMRDTNIKDRVEQRLARSSSLAGTDISVAVQDRTVSLQGTVGSEQDKERAVRLGARR